MPGGDCTGPQGMGPRTGRGAGWCAGRGRGFRGGFGGWGAPGWGWAAPHAPAYGYGAAWPETAAEEIAELGAQARQLERALDGIRRRIEELEAPEPNGEAR